MSNQIISWKRFPVRFWIKVLFIKVRFYLWNKLKLVNVTKSAQNTKNIGLVHNRIRTISALSREWLTKVKIFSLNQKPMVFIKIKGAWNNQLVFIIASIIFLSYFSVFVFILLLLSNDNYSSFEKVYIFYCNVNWHDYLFPFHGLGHDMWCHRSDILLLFLLSLSFCFFIIKLF